MDINVCIPSSVPKEEKIQLLWRVYQGRFVTKGQNILEVKYGDTFVVVRAKEDGILKEISATGAQDRWNNGQCVGVISTDIFTLEPPKDIVDEFAQYFTTLRDLENKNVEGARGVFARKMFFLGGSSCILTIIVLVLLISGSGWWTLLLFPIYIILYAASVKTFLVDPDWFFIKKYYEYLRLKPLEGRPDEQKQIQGNLQSKIRELEGKIGSIDNKNFQLRDEVATLKRELKEEKYNRNNDVEVLKKERQAAYERIEEMKEDRERSIGITDAALKDKDREIAKLKADLSRAKEKFQKDIRSRDEENRRLSREKDRARDLTISEFGFDQVLEYLNATLARDEGIKLPQDTVATLYGLLQERVPDKERMKELSLIPQELLRAQQIERITEWYSGKIDEVERSDLTDREKRDKINAYRTARERELGIEG